MGDLLRDSQWLLWLAAALILGVVELASFDFVFFMLVLGALAGSAAALLGFGFPVQAVAFAVVSILGLMLIRPALKRWVERSTPQTLTNVDALAGRPAIVLVQVTDRAGEVKLAGETWTARSADPGLAFAAGTDVSVVRIEGATAIIGPPVRQLETDS